MKILKNKINDPMLGSESHMGGGNRAHHTNSIERRAYGFSLSINNLKLRKGGYKYLEPLELEKRCVL